MGETLGEQFGKDFVVRSKERDRSVICYSLGVSFFEYEDGDGLGHRVGEEAVLKLLRH